MDGNARGRTRRDYLGAVAASGVIGIAGCLGGGSGGEPAGCEQTDESAVNELAAPVAGDPDADVTVLAFEDYACPHCATYSLEELPTVRSEYIEPGDVRYEFHDFPIPVSEKWSWEVASAARGVQDEVDDATFFEFARGMFERQDEFSYETIRSVAEDVGAPACAVVNDAANETYRPVLEADRQRAMDRGAGGTPAVYVNGRAVRPTADRIGAAVDAALEG
jgi:protein-disulfide isomerase